MRSLTRWLQRELKGATQRRPFRLRHMDLLNEVQRTLGYSVAAILSVPGAPTARAAATLLAFTACGIVSGIRGLRVRGNRPQAPPALLDLILAPLIMGIATSSPPVAAATGFSIAALILASFTIDVRVVAIGVGGGSLTSIAVFGFLGTENTESVITGAFVFLLSITVLVLAIMLLQWWNARRSLARREAELASLLAATPVMVATVSRDGAILSVAGDVPDRRWQANRLMEAVMPESLVEAVRSAMAGETTRLDMQIGMRWIAATCTPNPEGATLTAFDISEREEARRSLEALVETKDRFVASISHELRTPLTAVLGFAEELRRSEHITPDDRGYVEFIADQGSEMAAIIEDLLVAVRADLGLVTILVETVDIDTEAAAVVRSLESRMSRAVEIEGGGVRGLADPVRFRQILRNLLTNADRYGEGRIRLRTAVDATAAAIEVCDEGAPLAPERRDQIFLPYESSGRDVSLPSAIGLGLAVSRTLAEMMGGMLTYHHDGEWSVFRLALPLAAASTPSVVH